MTGILLFCFQLGEIAYHDFRGIFSNEEEKESIVKDLGDESKVLFCQWVELFPLMSCVIPALFLFNKSS